MAFEHGNLFPMINGQPIDNKAILNTLSMKPTHHFSQFSQSLHYGQLSSRQHLLARKHTFKVFHTMFMLSLSSSYTIIPVVVIVILH